MIQNYNWLTLKQWLKKLKRIVKWVGKVLKILVSDYKKRNDHEIFLSNTKLIASDSDIDEVFKSMHQSIITKITNYVCKDLIDLNVIIKHSIKMFVCSWINWDNK